MAPVLGGARPGPDDRLPARALPAPGALPGGVSSQPFADDAVRDLAGPAGR